MAKTMRQRILLVLRRQGKRPIAAGDLRKKAGIRETELAAYQKLLRQLKAEGTLVEQGSKYTLAHALGAVPAKVVKVRETFGFVRPDDAESDVFVTGRDLLGAMPGDRVLVKVRKCREKPLDEGRVLAVLEENDQLMSGEIVRGKKGFEVLPDAGVRFGLPISRSDAKTVKEGDKVVARLERRGESHFDHRAVLVERMGDSGLAKNCCEAILSANGISRGFPAEVAAQVEKIAGRGIRPAELEGRLDLRGAPIFTIDGADTKDIDDAVSVEKHGNGWALGVHIADVSYYVREQSALDREAFSRGTSVYFADSVIPMLPAALSNGICSLNPCEDRLAFSALLELDADGKITGYEFRKSVIRSRVKGVYSEVNRILEGDSDPELLAKYAGLADEISRMGELAEILKKRRFARGAMNLASTESKILIGEDGSAENVIPRTRGRAEEMIEEFMLAANEAAAALAVKAEIPFIYRVHEPPAGEKLETLRELLAAAGLPYSAVKPGAPSGALNKILDYARGTPFELAVNNAMLRSMAKAKYQEENVGHYGLALKDYAHFTSPIRRYPDLAIHRILSAMAAGESLDQLKRRFAKFVKSAGAHSSEAELRAMTVERDCEDCYKAEYMKKHLGERFEGVITSAQPHGIYVELDNTVEGLVRAADLPGGGYDYDGKMQFSLPDGSRRFRVGDRVWVLAAGADVSSGQIDFAIDDGDAKAHKDLGKEMTKARQ